MIDSGSHSSAEQSAGVFSGAPVKVLVVDDDETNRFVLKSMLTKVGHEVLLADDGAVAVTLYQKERPDLVLMDIMMPGLDGFKATAQIKALVEDEYLPVIFLTALSDEQALTESVRSGGDDFLTKPYKKDILQAKILAHLRLRELYQTAKKQRQLIEEHTNRLEHEQVLAKNIYEKMVHAGCLDIPLIRYDMSSMALFNGDILFASKNPSGHLHIMMGDFTGHGLSAAIGAVPLSGIFYSMTAKGFAIHDIVFEMNNKLKQLLPVGVFCAACIFELNMSDYTLKVWNGGIPAAYVVDQSGQTIRFELKSSHLPLGILPPARFDSTTQVYDVEVGDRVFLCTDGITEVRNPEGEMFGSERLKSVLLSGSEGRSVIEAVLEAVTLFSGEDEQEQSDDMTSIEVTVNPFLEILQGDGLGIDLDEMDFESEPKPAPVHCPDQSVTSWDMQLKLDVSTLRVVDPIPLLNQFAVDLSCRQESKQEIFMLISELVSNAIDHGLLELDSSLKKVPEGFMKYYQARAERLEQLREGSITVALLHRPEATGGSLKIFVRDTGKGFEYPTGNLSMRDNDNPSGRGIALVFHLCDSVRYMGCGNEVEAIYRWSFA
jgi:CheY-like chemotaxis protein/anti-sigma regulatory factor (Ser/Thr protein kinase)